MLIAVVLSVRAVPPVCDYYLNGEINNVYYRGEDKNVNKNIVCYVAVKEDQSSEFQNKYHSSTSIELCQYARTLLLTHSLIRMGGHIDGNQHITNDVCSLELYGKGTTFWT